jgi:hypothetical protein
MGVWCAKWLRAIVTQPVCEVVCATIDAGFPFFLLSGFMMPSTHAERVVASGEQVPHGACPKRCCVHSTASTAVPTRPRAESRRPLPGN